MAAMRMNWGPIEFEGFDDDSLSPSGDEFDDGELSGYSSDGYVPSEPEVLATPQLQETQDDGFDDQAEDLQQLQEDDFRRHIAAVGGASRDPNSAWNFEFGQNQEDQLDLDEDVRAAKKQGRRRLGRRRAEPKTSPYVKDLLQKATMANINQEYKEAITLLREVVQIEPGIAHVWNTLATLHRELGETEAALQLNIVAAHLMEPDIELWRSLGRQSRELNMEQQAIYCFRKLLTIEPHDLDALWDRSYLLRMSGHYGHALKGYLKLLTLQPGNPDPLDEIRLILIEQNDTARSAEIYQKSFDYHRMQTPGGPGYSGDEGTPIFGVHHIIALADFYLMLKQYKKAIRTIRSGARWLGGRATQDELWDNMADDREFAVEGTERVYKGPRPGYHALNVNMRQRLCIARLKLGDTVEAEMHADIIRSLDVIEYSVLFKELADVYFEKRVFDKALELYHMLTSEETTNTMEASLQLAACNRALGNYQDAIEIYQWAIEADPGSLMVKEKLAETYEIIGELPLALELINEVLQARKAANIANEDAKMSDGEPGRSNRKTKPKALFEERRGARVKRKKPTLEELKELEEERTREVQAAFALLDNTHDAMVSGDRNAVGVWLDEAGALVEEFRVTKALFTADRFAKFKGTISGRGRARAKNSEDAGDMADRLQRRMDVDILNAQNTLPAYTEGMDNFRGLSFDRWLLLISEYVFLLTREDQFPLADEVLRHVMLANIYHPPEYQTKLRMTLLACSLRAKEYVFLLDHSRSLMQSYQFNNEPVRLLLATIGSGIYAVEGFTDTRFHKAMARELKFFDSAVKGQLEWNTRLKRWTMTSGEADDDDTDEERDESDEASPQRDIATPAPKEKTNSKAHKTQLKPKATKHSPVFYATMGLLCLCARSFQSAMWYLFNAHEIMPKDPLICLSLGVACMCRAMQRQVDNRQHVMAMATGLFNTYRSLRRDAKHADEVDFNFGRAFQQVGLHSLAVKHYTAVLALAEKRQETSPGEMGMAREAAYNLSIIHVTNGAPLLAKELYERWLSI